LVKISDYFSRAKLRSTVAGIKPVEDQGAGQGLFRPAGVFVAGVYRVGSGTPDHARPQG
jgi:hypothetical protein